VGVGKNNDKLVGITTYSNPFVVGESGLWYYDSYTLRRQLIDLEQKVSPCGTISHLQGYSSSLPLRGRVRWC
jgi:hypothetical protein